MKFQAAVITVSDGCFHQHREDLSGPALATALENIGIEVLARDLVPDEPDAIISVLQKYTLESPVHLIMTTGGTGFGPRDVTPEATAAVCEKQLPGFGELMRSTSLRYVPTAILSRQIAGIRGQTLIVNLPGRPKAIRENLEAVFPAIPYCIDLIGGPRLESHSSTMKSFRPQS